MKEIINHIFEELMDAQEYSRAAMSKETGDTYKELAGEELTHEERLIEAGDRIIKTPEEEYLWDFERGKALEWWKKIKHELE